MRVEIRKNFLTPEECQQLTRLTEYGVANNLMTLGNKTNVRLTSRLHPELYNYPQWVLDLSNRVRTFCGIADYPIISHQGKDGIVTNFTPPTGDVFVHTDARSPDGMAALRCNIITRQAEIGGVLYINGQPFHLEAGDLHCYLVSEYEHHVTLVEGNVTRVNWIFGAYVSKDAWESGQIVVQS